MSNFNRTVRNTFFTPDGKHEFDNAPIGWDEIEQSVKRGKNTDGNTLSISQNQEFVKEDAKFIVSELSKQGVGGLVEQLREEKINGDWVEVYRDFADLITGKWSKEKATFDFRDNSFDKKFSDIKKEKVELDRETDLDGNAISTLEKRVYRHKTSEILLRTRLENEEGYSETFTVNTVTNDLKYFITPKMTIDYSSDPNYFNVLDFEYLIESNAVPINDQSVANMFLYDCDGSGVVSLKLDSVCQIAINSGSYNNARFKIKVYNNGINLDFVEDINLGSVISGNTTETLDTTYELEYLSGYSYAFGLEIESTFDNSNVDVTFTQASIEAEENSLFEPDNVQELYIDALTLKDCFVRWFEIADSNVTFESDLIDNDWPNLILFSGETLRHVTYIDAENDTETKAPIATVSFDYLYDAINTIVPCTYTMEQKGDNITFRLEEVKYTTDDSEAIHLGALTEIEYTINKDRTYSTIEIGYKNSGENEEVQGLQATHTVNIYKLPYDGEKVYKAVTDARTDPREVELGFRKQQSKFPDEDTQYDKDNFIVDCKVTIEDAQEVYKPREWTEDFTQVDGVYSPDTLYNYRLSPMNCLLRHDYNFMQEYIKPAYDNASMIYLSTSGNVSLRTQLVGGTLRPENGTIAIRDFRDPIYTNLVIKGKAYSNYELFKQINGGLDKKNHYKTLTYIDDTGFTQKAFSESLVTKKGVINVELREKV